MPAVVHQDLPRESEEFSVARTQACCREPRLRSCLVSSAVDIVDQAEAGTTIVVDSGYPVVVCVAGKTVGFAGPSARTMHSASDFLVSNSKHSLTDWCKPCPRLGR